MSILNLLISDRRADPTNAMMRLQEVAVARGEGDPVAATIYRLATDRAFRIGATVENNPTAVKANFQEVTGRSVKVVDLTTQLLAMDAAGKSAQVDAIILVPFLQGTNSDLEKAFIWFKGEVGERAADPNDVGMQRVMQRFGGGPYFDDNDIPTDTDSGTPNTGGNTGGGEGFDWSILLASLPGIISLFTNAGKTPPAPAATTTAPRTDNTRLFVTIGVMLLLVGGVLYFMMRKK